MSTPAKYIIIQDRNGRERAILFPAEVSHDWAVNFPIAPPIAAGMFYLNPKSKLATAGVVVLEGIGSITLNRKPRPQDARLIAETIASFDPALPEDDRQFDAPRPEPQHPAVTPEAMTVADRAISLVCQTYRVTIEQLESRRRPWRIVWPRFLAMHLIRRYSDASLEGIGHLFNKDHVTVLHALRAVEREVETNCARGREVAALEKAMYMGASVSEPALAAA